MISDETTLGFSPQWGHEVSDHIRCDSWLQLASEPFVSIHLQMNMPGSFNSGVAPKPRHYGRQGVRFGQHRGSAWVWANQLKACASYRRSGSVAFFIERKDSIVELFSAMMVSCCARKVYGTQIWKELFPSENLFLPMTRWSDRFYSVPLCLSVNLCNRLWKESETSPGFNWDLGGRRPGLNSRPFTHACGWLCEIVFCGWLFSHGLLAVTLILCSWEWLYVFLSSFFMTCALNTVITSWY